MAKSQCIVVADRARARLFSVEDQRETPFDEPRHRLTERSDLASPESKAIAESGRGHQREEAAKRFAKDLVAATSGFVRERKSKGLVLVASPKFLGLIRPELKKVLPKGVELTELAEDLTWHAQSHIEKVLKRHGVLENERVRSTKAAGKRRRRAPV